MRVSERARILPSQRFTPVYSSLVHVIQKGKLRYQNKRFGGLPLRTFYLILNLSHCCLSISFSISLIVASPHFLSRSHSLSLLPLSHCCLSISFSISLIVTSPHFLSRSQSLSLLLPDFRWLLLSLAHFALLQASDFS